MSLEFNILDYYCKSLDDLGEGKLLINTINAHSFNVAQNDQMFSEALMNSTVLLPDGISIVLASLLLYGRKIKKISGMDLYDFEMNRLNSNHGSCFFLGSTEETLNKICVKAKVDFPHVQISTMSPPFVNEFTDTINEEILSRINIANPDVLFIGMTAPKQEKWAYANMDNICSNHICSIGAVFDFYAGNINRAPKWLINIGLEWFYRLVKEPRRMWRRYILGNTKFIITVLLQFINRQKLDVK